MQYDLPFTMLLFDNSPRGRARWEVSVSGLRSSGAADQAPDVAALVRAAGAYGVRVAKAEQLTGALEEAFRHRGPVRADGVTDLAALWVPPKTGAETVAGFARPASKIAYGGDGGRVIRMARSGLPDLPGPRVRRSAEPPGGHASRRPVREQGYRRDIAVRVGAKNGKPWGRGRPVQREPSAGGGGGGEAVDTLRITRSVRRADLKAVGEVRRDLRELMRHRCRTDAAEVAELLITELVTNALVHTDRGAEVHASLAATRLRVEVRDYAARRPRPYVPTADDGTHGRGLVLVQALADNWGVDALALGSGKVVWFELDGRHEAS